MKKLYLTMLAFVLPLLGTAKKNNVTNIRWGTFNIRYLNSEDNAKGVGWDTRKDRVCQWVLDTRLDIIGMQEVTHQQLLDILERMPGFDYVGVGRTDGKEGGEYTPIFYRRDRFKALSKGNFWLSETPDVAGSKGWDALLPRVVSWVKLKDLQTGKVFMAVNTHFDHRGQQALVESAKLIIQKIQEIVGNKPAVVTGDFNMTNTNPAYATMVGSEFVLRDAYYMSPEHQGVRYTSNGFRVVDPEKGHKIDFIFVTSQIGVMRTGIPKDNIEAPLSDHNPHWADLQF